MTEDRIKSDDVRATYSFGPSGMAHAVRYEFKVCVGERTVTGSGLAGSSRHARRLIRKGIRRAKKGKP